MDGFAQNFAPRVASPT